MPNEKLDTTDDSMLVATFFLGDAAFGIDTAQLQEVVRVGHITPVHHAPAWVLGVMNLRGRIATIFDLRIKLDMPHVEPCSDSRIFIVEWHGEQIGLLVDRVADAVSVEADAVRPSPGNVGSVQGQHVQGVCPTADGRLAALLNLEAVLRVEEDRPHASARNV